MRLLHRLRPRHHRIEIDELAVILGLRLGPDFLHRLDALAHPLEARGVHRSVVFHLVLVPAAADAKQEAALADLIDGGDELRGLDRIALLHEQHAGAEFDRFGRRSRGSQDHERVHRIGILLGQFAAAWERRLARERNMRMLGRPDAVIAALLQRDCQLRRRHGILGKEHCTAELHVVPHRCDWIDQRRRSRAARLWYSRLGGLNSDADRNTGTGDKHAGNVGEGPGQA